METIKTYKLDAKYETLDRIKKNYNTLKPILQYNTANVEKLEIDYKNHIIRLKFQNRIIYIHYGRGAYDPEKHLMIDGYYYIFKICMYRLIT